MSNAAIIIPARMDSTRLPGKPLLTVGQRTLLHRTHDAAVQSNASHFYIAADDSDIISYVNEGKWKETLESGDVLMHCECAHGTCGTERCANLVKKERWANWDAIVNLQVDEPLIPPDVLNALIRMANDEYVVTVVAPFKPRAGAADDENVVKAAVSHGRCHWFSRKHIGDAMQHVGVYAFGPKLLQRCGELHGYGTDNEESLEQLRWLEAGISIVPHIIDKAPLSVNTEQDLTWLRRMFI